MKHVIAHVVANVLYGLCTVVAVIIIASALITLVAGSGDNPTMAGAMGLALAALCYGFGWSGRRLLQGRA